MGKNNTTMTEIQCKTCTKTQNLWYKIIISRITSVPYESDLYSHSGCSINTDIQKPLHNYTYWNTLLQVLYKKLKSQP